jgi:branched-chain amino acid transport system ATP-binding protein
MDLVFRVARRIIVLVAGEILVEGTPQEISRNTQVRELYLGSAHE